MQHPSPATSSRFSGQAQCTKARIGGGGHAFSLIELMVTMLIGTAVVSVVLWLTMQTGNATRAGITISEINAKVIAFDDVLRLDEANFIKPSASGVGGAMVIVPALRKGKIDGRDVWLRSDQMIIACARNSSANRAGANPTMQLPADIRKGYVLVDRDGDGTPEFEWRETEDSLLWLGAVRQPGESEDATRWTLGRQRICLHKGGTLDTLGPDPATDIRSYDDADPANPSRRPLEVLANALRSLPGVRTETMDQLAGTAGPVEDEYVKRLLPAMTTANRKDYQTQPVVDTRVLADGNLTLGDFIQTHPLALDLCSEVMIQFAGDYDYDGMIDTNPDLTVKWYPDDRAFFDATGAPATTLPGPLVFHTDDNNPRTVRHGYFQDGKKSHIYRNKFGHQFPYPFAPDRFTDDYFTWSTMGPTMTEYGGTSATIQTDLRFGRYTDPQSLAGTTNFGDELDIGNGTDDDGDGTVDEDAGWYNRLISPRAQTYDMIGGYPQDPDGTPGTADDPSWMRRSSNWPRAIRIRLRLHDRSAKIRTTNDTFNYNGRDDDGDPATPIDQNEQRCTGVWYEFILTAPHPYE